MNAAATSFEEQDLARLKSGLPWSGYLTLANYEAVHARIVALIGEGRVFTYASYRGDRDQPPEVRTGLTAEHITVRGPGLGDPDARIAIEDPRWLHFLDTRAADQAEAGKPKDPRDRPPFVTLTGDRLDVCNYLSSGARAYDAFVVQSGPEVRRG